MSSGVERIACLIRADQMKTCTCRSIPMKHLGNKSGGDSRVDLPQQLITLDAPRLKIPMVLAS
jgi:hypothetical protein